MGMNLSKTIVVIVVIHCECVEIIQSQNRFETFYILQWGDENPYNFFSSIIRKLSDFPTSEEISMS